ncbi:hypothetical protein TWF281_003218 [Arthrobotrys megalospora]
MLLLLQLSGPPGSGKSTLAQALSRNLKDTISINHDTLKSFLLANIPSLPFTESSKLSYSLQWTLAEDVLKQGKSVIIDSTCNYPETLKAGQELAEKYGYEYLYIECRLEDIDLLDRRLKGRSDTALRSQRTGVNHPPQGAGVGDINTEADNRELFRRWIESPCRPSNDQIIYADTTKSPEECLDYVLKQIGLRAQGGQT